MADARELVVRAPARDADDPSSPSFAEEPGTTIVALGGVLGKAYEPGG